MPTPAASPTAAAVEPKPKRKGGRTPKSAEARKVEAKATQQQVKRFSDSQDKVISKLEEELVKLEEELAKERVKSHDFYKVIRHMQQQLLGVDLERAEAVEALEKYIVEKPDKHAESVIGAVKFFEGGRYTDTIRTIYYTLLKNEMSPGRCHIVVGSILKKMNITYDRLPQKAAAILMNLERSALVDMHAARTLAGQEDGSVAMAGDEATKLGKSRFALGMFMSEDGPGSPILFAALGIIDSLGGSAEATKEAIVTLLERLSGNLQILRRHLGEDYDADGDNIDELLKKFRATMSDSCMAQQNVNALMLRLCAEALCGEGATEDEIEDAMKNTRSFYCWLRTLPLPGNPVQTELTSPVLR